MRLVRGVGVILREWFSFGRFIFQVKPGTQLYRLCEVENGMLRRTTPWSASGPLQGQSDRSRQLPVRTAVTQWMNFGSGSQENSWLCAKELQSALDKASWPVR